MSPNYKAAEIEAREEFIKERTRQETIVANWWEKISGNDPAILASLNLPEVCTLETLIPELYKEKPDKAVYLQQLGKARELFARVNQIGVAYNEEAARCLLEFQELGSTIA